MSFIKTLMVIAILLTSLVQAHYNEVLSSRPVIQGEINGMKVLAQGDVAMFIATESNAPLLYSEKSHTEKSHIEHCSRDLHCALKTNNLESVALSPLGIWIFDRPEKNSPKHWIHKEPEDPYSIEIDKFSSNLENLTASHIPLNFPQPTATLHTGNQAIDKTPGILLISSPVMEWLAETVTTVSVSRRDTDSYDTLTTIIEPTPEDKKNTLTTITQEHDELLAKLTSVSVMPTPVIHQVENKLWEDSSVRLETEFDYLTIKPSPCNQNESKNKASSHLTFTTRQAPVSGSASQVSSSQDSSSQDSVSQGISTEHTEATASATQPVTLAVPQETNLPTAISPKTRVTTAVNINKHLAQPWGSHIECIYDAKADHKQIVEICLFISENVMEESIGDDFYCEKESIKNAFSCLADELKDLFEKKVPKKMTDWRTIREAGLMDQDHDEALNLTSYEEIMITTSRRVVTNLAHMKLQYYTPIDENYAFYIRAFVRKYALFNILEVGSGSGLWAKALTTDGPDREWKIKVKATDDGSMSNSFKEGSYFTKVLKTLRTGRTTRTPNKSSTLPSQKNIKYINPDETVVPVEKLDSLTAVKLYRDSHDLLLITSPSENVLDALTKWPDEKPVLIIMIQDVKSCLANYFGVQKVKLEEYEQKFLPPLPSTLYSNVMNVCMFSKLRFLVNGFWRQMKTK